MTRQVDLPITNSLLGRPSKNMAIKIHSETFNKLHRQPRDIIISGG